ncbi:uncharacterized protein N7459_003355 [Penicillium hispanicum]|uniref:uncharacterized protein n=1 Tax=Penicillium hispanicum TaxID=1080232 RepID=UPI002540D54B|nr:uncharacterized protein N7459_003355 [Penicillium hispanicum]KAJ5587590.1 hypothetical protein N7459_003355 [Penicillium hispanicum]
MAAEPDIHVARYGEDRECFLENLPPPVPRYMYQDSQQFHRILDYETARFRNMNYTLATLHHDTLQPATDDNSNYIVFLIDPSSFKHEILHRNDQGPLGFLYEYDPITKILSIKMTTREHRCAARAMNTLIEAALRGMELDLKFESFASVNVIVGANEQVKVPDEGWAPLTSAHEAPNRPAVVLEVGVSETETKLREDARMWVDPARGQANIAITIKIKRDQPLVKIDKWEWNMVTRRPQVNHHIEIAGGGGTVTVSGEPLLIPFLKIWRKKTRYPKERDIVRNTQDLVFLATHIWAAMGMDY